MRKMVENIFQLEGIEGLMNLDGQQQQEGLGDDVNPRKRKRGSTKRACSECRKAKTKCEATEDGSCCLRCQTKKLECDLGSTPSIQHLLNPLLLGVDPLLLLPHQHPQSNPSTPSIQSILSHQSTTPSAPKSVQSGQVKGKHVPIEPAPPTIDIPLPPAPPSIYPVQVESLTKAIQRQTGTIALLTQALAEFSMKSQTPEFDGTTNPFVESFSEPNVPCSMWRLNPNMRGLSAMEFLFANKAFFDTGLLDEFQSETQARIKRLSFLKKCQFLGTGARCNKPCIDSRSKTGGTTERYIHGVRKTNVGKVFFKNYWCLKKDIIYMKHEFTDVFDDAFEMNGQKYEKTFSTKDVPTDRQLEIVSKRHMVASGFLTKEMAEWIDRQDLKEFVSPL